MSKPSKPMKFPGKPAPSKPVPVHQLPPGHPNRYRGGRPIEAQPVKPSQPKSPPPKI